MDVWIVLGIVLAVLLVVSLFGGAGMMGFGGFGMGPGMMGGFGMHGFGNQFGVGFNPLGAILLFAFWAFIIGGIGLIIVWAVRQSGSYAAGSDRRPLDILKERYARGELTREQYEEIRHDLQ